MKTENLLVLGLAGVVAYKLLASQKQPDTTNPTGGMGGFALDLSGLLGGLNLGGGSATTPAPQPPIVAQGTEGLQSALAAMQKQLAEVGKASAPPGPGTPAPDPFKGLIDALTKSGGALNLPSIPKVPIPDLRGTTGGGLGAFGDILGNINRFADEVALAAESARKNEQNKSKASSPLPTHASPSGQKEYLSPWEWMQEQHPVIQGAAAAVGVAGAGILTYKALPLASPAAGMLARTGLGVGSDLLSSAGSGANVILKALNRLLGRIPGVGLLLPGTGETILSFVNPQYSQSEQASNVISYGNDRQYWPAPAAINRSSEIGAAFDWASLNSYLEAKTKPQEASTNSGSSNPVLQPPGYVDEGSGKRFPSAPASPAAWGVFEGVY